MKKTYKSLNQGIFILGCLFTLVLSSFSVIADEKNPSNRPHLNLVLDESDLFAEGTDSIDDENAKVDENSENNLSQTIIIGIFGAFAAAAILNQQKANSGSSKEGSNQLPMLLLVAGVAVVMANDPTGEEHMELKEKSPKTGSTVGTDAATNFKKSLGKKENKSVVSFLFYNFRQDPTVKARMLLQF